MDSSSTIILPTRGSKYLRQAIYSIKADTRFQNINIFLLDNSPLGVGSDILSSLQPNDEYMKFSTSSSLSEMLNFGIENTGSEVIFRMDDDDVWKKGRYKSQINLLNAGFDIVLGKIQNINQRGHQIPSSRLSGRHTFSPELLLLGNHIVHPSIAIRRDLLLAHRFRNIQLEDYDLWMRVFEKKVNFATCKDEVLEYRIHHSTVSSTYQFNHSSELYASYVSLCQAFNVNCLSEESFAALVKPRNNLDKLSYEQADELLDYGRQLSEIFYFKSKVGKLHLSDNFIGIIKTQPSLYFKFWPVISLNKSGFRRILRQFVRYCLLNLRLG